MLPSESVDVLVNEQYKSEQLCMNPATGAALGAVTVTVFAVEAEFPLLSVTDRVTVRVPAEEYVCEGF